MAAPTKHVLQASTARAHATIRVATATSATAALRTAPQVSTAAAAAARVRAHVQDARMHRRVRHTLVRALSTRTIVHGDAMRLSIIKMENASAVPIRHVPRENSGLVRVITRVAMATSATAVFLTARQVSIAVAALERVLDRARAAPTSQTTRHTRGKDPST